MIEVLNISVKVGEFALHGITFSVPKGNYAVLMGRTGSGKTTILSCICGLLPVRSGRIRLSGRDVTHVPPAARGIGYVPQDAALFPTMTVGEHLAFPLYIRRWSREKVRERTDELAELLGLDHLLKRRPHGLSGGEAQRVALGRALSFRPEILLLDEPLSALDEETRAQMYSLLKRVQEHTHVTALHITHSRQDAQMLADCKLHLTDGTISEVDEAAWFELASTGSEEDE